MKNLIAYTLIAISVIFGVVSAALLYQSIIHLSATLLAFGIFALSLGLYIYYFSKSQILRSTPEVQMTVVGGLAAPRWLSWLISISSLMAGVMILTNIDLSSGDNWLVRLSPFLFISFLGVLAATARNRK